MKFLKKFVIFVLMMSAFNAVILALSNYNVNAKQMPNCEVSSYIQRKQVKESEVPKVDILIQKYSSALLSKDYSNAKLIDKKLSQYGVESTSNNEELKCTNQKMLGRASAFGFQKPKVSFRTAESTIRVRNKSIRIMRIYAIPQRGSNLYHEGIVPKDVKTNNAAKN